MCAPKCHGRNLTKWKISNESADEKKTKDEMGKMCIYEPWSKYLVGISAV